MNVIHKFKYIINTLIEIEHLSSIIINVVIEIHNIVWCVFSHSIWPRNMAAKTPRAGKSVGWLGRTGSPTLRIETQFSLSVALRQQASQDQQVSIILM